MCTMYVGVYVQEIQQESGQRTAYTAQVKVKLTDDCQIRYIGIYMLCRAETDVVYIPLALPSRVP